MRQQFENQKKIIKLRQKEAYYAGMMDGIEEFVDVLNKHYFNEKDDPARYSLYEASESMYGYYMMVVEETQEKITELMQKERTDA
jgi:hypothetical protein